MDIFDRGVVHAAASAGFGVQCAFKNCAKNGRAYFRPVESYARFFQKQLAALIRKHRNFNVFISEKPSVHIGESGKFGFEVWVAVCRFGIKNFEKVNESFSKMYCIESIEVVMEHSSSAKDSRILCIKAEYETDAENVEALEGAFVFFVDVLSQKCIVKFSYDFTRFDGNFHFFLKVFVLAVYEEVETIIFSFKVFKKNNFRLASGMFHVIDAERFKVAGDYPTGAL